MPGGRRAKPPGQGTPCRVPSSPRSGILLDFLPSLEGQTTFKSDETKTITSVSKRASQRCENRVDTTSVLQENLQKTKEDQVKKIHYKRKGEDPRGRHPPKGVGH